MRHLNIALLGFGTVGKGVFETIQTHKQNIEHEVGAQVNVTVIVIQHPEKHMDSIAGARITTDIHAVLDDPSIDIVFEATVGTESAFSYLKQCIHKGKHVITANKEMFAGHGNALKTLALTHQVEIKYDATTAGGIPAIQTIQELLHINNIQKIEAILNGTSNYILTAMREGGVSFDAALEEAKRLGYAEADPTNDIAGYDAFYKTMILSDLVFGDQPAWDQVELQGISDIGSNKIKELNSRHEKIKHIATLTRSNGEIGVQIRPTIVSGNHPLYGIEGVDNAVHIQTDIIGSLTLTGPGAGASPTASAMIEDLCILMKEQANRKQLNVIDRDFLREI